MTDAGWWQTHLITFFKECAARNTGNFSAVVQQLSPDEINVMQKAVNGQ